eukprot:2927054-Prymnesium_polylepis.1
MSTRQWGAGRAHEPGEPGRGRRGWGSNDNAHTYMQSRVMPCCSAPAVVASCWMLPALGAGALDPEGSWAGMFRVLAVAVVYY